MQNCVEVPKHCAQVSTNDKSDMPLHLYSDEKRTGRGASSRPERPPCSAWRQVDKNASERFEKKRCEAVARQFCCRATATKFLLQAGGGSNTCFHRVVEWSERTRLNRRGVSSAERFGPGTSAFAQTKPSGPYCLTLRLCFLVFLARHSTNRSKATRNVGWSCRILENDSKCVKKINATESMKILINDPEQVRLDKLFQWAILYSCFRDRRGQQVTFWMSPSRVTF